LSNPRLFLSAGEASGDHYGAELIAALRPALPDASFFGLGGREMEHAGMDRVARAEDVAHMGITEVVRHIPRIYASYRRLVNSIRTRRPQTAVLIDFPEVNLRLARELKALGVPVIYFVSPQLWAWKRYRIRWVQQRVDRMMVIFPFEEAFYRAYDVDANFVGHPLAELPLPAVSREDYAREHRLDPSCRWVALLPGSRRKEIRSNLTTMLQAAAQLHPANDYEFLLPVASTLDTEWIREQAAPWMSRLSLRLVDDAREALFHARASVVASGTATVQAAVIGNPFVVVYRVSPLTFWLAKHLVRYSPEIWPSAQTDESGNPPIGMVNLIAGRRIVPELIQRQFTAANIAAAFTPLLGDTPQRARMMTDLAELRGRLRSRTGAIGQVASAVLDQLGLP